MSRIQLAAGLAAACLLSACSTLRIGAINGIETSRSKTAVASAVAAGDDELAPAIERDELILAATDDNQLVSFNAARPGALLSRTALQGLQAGERLLGISFRVARGQLYGLSDRGRLLRIDPASGKATPVGPGIKLPHPGGPLGFDINPAADRIRVLDTAGASLRVHPDTGSQVDGDEKAPGPQPDADLAYVAGDVLGGRQPGAVGVAYTYEKQDDKLSTGYVIDARQGYLAILGSKAGSQPVVSPVTGRLSSVGPLLIKPFEAAGFDIGDVGNAAYLVTTASWSAGSRLYAVDLATGQAKLIGAVGVDARIRAIAVQP
ncbi:MAG: DUF4394 domain-containing protein [Aquabacterium sp.]|nr:MAG: DUF4394 domain-containing protein [Aquabacterium sp.]